MLLANLILGGLDYNAVDRDRISNSNFLKPSLVEEVINYEESESLLETKSTYLFEFKGISSVYRTISLKLKEEFEKGSISSDVYKTSYNLISYLPESILFKLESDNVYPTNYGTVVLDWQDDKSLDEFSLEIGNSCFGYFSELDGKDVINVEEVSFSFEEVNELHNRIEEFYQR